MADSSGETVDNKTRLEVIRQQETLIKEEAAEKQKEVSVIAVTVSSSMVCVYTERRIGGCSSSHGEHGGERCELSPPVSADLWVNQHRTRLL